MIKNLSPQNKKKLVFAVAGVVVVLVALLLYSSDSGRKENSSADISKAEKLRRDEDVFSEGLFKKTRKELGIVYKAMKAQNERIGNIEEAMEGLTEVAKALNEALAGQNEKIGEIKKSSAVKPVVKSAGGKIKGSDKSVPDIPPRPGSFRKVSVPGPPAPEKVSKQTDRLFRKPPPPRKKKKGKKGEKGEAVPQFTGGISIVSADKEEAGKKKSDAEETAWLPPSFMDAVLLSGVAAPTMTSGRTRPVPMLIRVSDPAFLPNDVRADLKGCFIIAEGTGSLAMERVEGRTVTLSCLSKNGESVIDQTVIGFLVDRDGTVGLRGTVVAKFGSHLARVGLAGFINGLGTALSDSVSQTDTVLTTGVAEKTMKDDSAGTYLKAGSGEGVRRVSERLEEFYLELAEQTMPVIEVGATKKITVVISQGTKLVIKRHKYIAGSGR